MKLVRCRNGFLEAKNGRCGHIVAMLTDSQVAGLKTDPERGPVYRCPLCPADQRWMQVVDDGNGPVMQVIDKPEVFPEELIYTDEHVFNQIA